MTQGNSEAGRLGHGGQHRTVRTPDGQRWHVVEGGDPTRITLVLVAGFPQSAYAWRRVLPLLAERFHVLAVDLPGQGYSAAPVDGFDTSTTARRISALLAHLGVGEHIYVGHDVGAWVGYAYAHVCKTGLAGVALLDANIPGVTLPASIEVGPDSWRSWHFLFNAVPDLPEALLAGRERLLIEWFFAGKTEDWTSTFSAEDIDEYVRAYATPGVTRGMLGYYRAVLQDTEDHAAFVHDPTTVPVLALGGDKGSAPDLFDKLSPLVADIRGGLIADSGHYIPEEQPAALAQRLLSFADEIL